MVLDESNVHNATVEEQLNFWKDECLRVRGQVDAELSTRRSQDQAAPDPMCLFREKLDTVLNSISHVKECCHDRFFVLSRGKGA